MQEPDARESPQALARAFGAALAAMQQASDDLFGPLERPAWEEAPRHYARRRADRLRCYCCPACASGSRTFRWFA